MSDQPSKPSAISVKRAKEILKLLLDRLPDKRMQPCVVCTQTEWQFVPGFISIVMTENPGQVALGGRHLPCVAVVCGVCGNTLLLNTNVLGIDQVVTPEPAELKLEVTPPIVRQTPTPKEEE